MKILLDSHIFLWLLFEPNKINAQARKQLDQADVVYVSDATIWELGLKHRKGMLVHSPTKLLEARNLLGTVAMPMNAEHILIATSPLFIYKDPFDHMLIAQAQSEACIFLTADNAILDLKLPFVADARS